MDVFEISEESIHVLKYFQPCPNQLYVSISVVAMWAAVVNSAYRVVPLCSYQGGNSSAYNPFETCNRVQRRII